MNLRQLNIGARLGFGFGLILLAATAILLVSMVSSSLNRSALIQTIQNAASRPEQAVVMRHALMRSAVAARNMGLETSVDGVQKAEAEAKKAVSYTHLT